MSLRDRIRSRELPHAKVALRVDWSDESDENHRELIRCQQRLHDAVVSRFPEETIEGLRDDVAEAQKVVDASYEILVVRSIPAADMEQLMAEHPPTEEDLKKDPTATFNKVTFYPALLAASIDGPETAEDWVEMITSGSLSPGEVSTLISTTLEINDRSPSVSLGKDSTTTSS